MISKGTLFTISAPSGAGKTSLVKALLESDEQVQVSVSHTTRPMRPGEVKGQDYHFIDNATFQEMILDGAFLEYAGVFDYHYGTAKAWVEETLNKGVDVILEIDWQGARQVKTQMPQAQGIFILPPSKQALADRLKGRGQDKHEVIERRMQDAISEMSHYNESQWLIVNDDFDQALAQLQGIIRSQRLYTYKQRDNQQDLLDDLLC